MAQTSKRKTAICRPHDLPDYGNPPLIEVVIDLQFAAIPNFHQIHAADIWNLYKNKFPKIEEHPPLSPNFEAFGSPRTPQFGFDLSKGPMQTRYWFLTNKGDELIQFQNNRFIRNWRKFVGDSIVYPRFDVLASRFQNEFSALENFVRKAYSHEIAINQCEVKYLNHIKNEKEGFIRLEDYLRFANFGDFELDDFIVKFRRTIRTADGSPILRLICESGVVITSDGSSAVKLEITARGAPNGSTFDAALDLCARARKEIVNLFTEITTETAHKIWRRIK